MIPPIRRPRIASQFAERERIQSVVAQEYTTRGRILTQGIGQFHHEILFPVTYYERPMIIIGAVELDDEEAVFEQFPYAEVGVSRWNKFDSSVGPNAAAYYTGVHVAIRIAGRTGQTAWIPYKIEGKALSTLNVEDDSA